MSPMEFIAFTREHLPGVLALCKAEGWPSMPADPDRAVRALSASGAITVVAKEGEEIVGFAQLVSDGEIQAYLCSLAVAARWRRQGIGQHLVQEAFARSGAMRVDVLAADESQGFYRSFEHRSLPGYRIYPEPRGNGSAKGGPVGSPRWDGNPTGHSR
jgi:ribosomal protein S18 acetylase RimI-like enzyme